MSIDTTACFTGHRPNKLGGYYDNPLQQAIKDYLRIKIGELISRQYTDFISGGAIGLDQWAAEEVIYTRTNFDYRTRLIIARPFPSQSKIWPAAAQEYFNSLCVRANKIVDVSPDPYAAWKMQKRNEWMVDHSSTVVAVWDGSPGGTANCVQYARSKKKHIILIDPRAMKV